MERQGQLVAVTVGLVMAIVSAIASHLITASGYNDRIEALNRDDQATKQALEV